MKVAFFSVFAVIFLAVGYAVGCWMQRDQCEAEVHRQLADQAVQGLLRALLTARSIDDGAPDRALEYNDIAIHSLLHQLSENGGHDVGPEWTRAKVKTLNAIALVWAKHPPFRDASWRSDGVEWAESWERIQETHLALLEWARAECAAHPEYDCLQSL